jgi:hypothetical protein
MGTKFPDSSRGVVHRFVRDGHSIRAVAMLVVSPIQERF